MAQSQCPNSPTSPSTGNSMELILLQPQQQPPGSFSDSSNLIEEDGHEHNKHNNLKYGLRWPRSRTPWSESCTKGSIPKDVDACSNVIKKGACEDGHLEPRPPCTNGSKCKYFLIGDCKYRHDDLKNSTIYESYDPVSSIVKKKDQKFLNALEKRNYAGSFLGSLKIKLEETTTTLNLLNKQYEEASKVSVLDTDCNLKKIESKISTVSLSIEELLFSLKISTTTLNHSENTLNQCSKNLEDAKKHEEFKKRHV
jgi:hypothetical protein